GHRHHLVELHFDHSHGILDFNLYNCVTDTFVLNELELCAVKYRLAMDEGGKQPRILSLHLEDNPQKLQVVPQDPEGKFARTWENRFITGVWLILTIVVSKNMNWN